MLKDLLVYTLTWNVKGLDPVENLEEALQLKDNVDVNEVPDIYAIGLQEVSTTPRSMLMGIIFEDPWCKAFRQTFEKWDFIQLKIERLRGILLLIFVKRRHFLHVRGLQTEYTRTGIGGLWGNKGGVTTRMKIYGCSVCFVNCHLAAHDNELKQRIEDYNSIIDGQMFADIETENILCHDYIFWMGDLNFRVSDLSSEEVRKMIENGECDKLLEKDQLNLVRRNGEAFTEFSETTPTFKPTYKYYLGRNEYDHSRKPGYTDRILFKINPNVYENVTLDLQQLTYTSHENYVQSDHKPVSGLFNIKVFARTDKSPIEFLSITKWTEGEDRICRFITPTDFVPTNWDWIGLFKTNFSSIEDYITYVWVPQQLESTTQDNKCEINLLFPSISISPGQYSLVYISSDFNDILGISTPFEVESWQLN